MPCDSSLAPALPPRRDSAAISHTTETISARVLLGIADRRPSCLHGDVVQTVDLRARRHREGEMLPSDSPMQVRTGAVLASREQDELGFIVTLPGDGGLSVDPSEAEGGHDRVELPDRMGKVIDGDAEVIEDEHRHSLAGLVTGGGDPPGRGADRAGALRCRWRG